MPDAAFSRRRLLKRGLAVGAFGLGLGVDAFGIEPEWIDVTHIEVPIQGLPEAFDGYRIALFSDVHWPRQIDKAYIRRVVRLANDFRPDLVAVPGDLCDRRGYPGDNHVTPDLRGLFDDLRAQDGAVATLGNHDYGFIIPDLHRAIRDETPLELVENRHKIIQRGEAKIAVGGVEDLYFGHVDVIGAFAGLGEEVPRILLSHNPDVAEDYGGGTRVDLQLSGHTHGGEVRIPFGPAPRIPSKHGQKFREGLVEGRWHRVYVTRGVCSPRRVRFFCRPEVSHITLTGDR